MPLYIGTSGWQYKHWRERFYPKGVPQRSWLEYYADRFQTVEVNNAFYMLPKPETFKTWAARTPADFIVGVKVSRYLTHIKRLNDPAEPVARFMSHARNLGPKLGPLLVQLPPTLKVNVDALDEALRLFGKDVRVAVEFRHDSWFVEEVKTVLSSHGAALVLADRSSSPVTPLWRTADWGYVRWHWGIGSPMPCYRPRDMKAWAERIAEMWRSDEDVYAYFNNDPEGCALQDARVFAEAASDLGLEPTRTAPRGDVRVGEVVSG